MPLVLSEILEIVPKLLFVVVFFSLCIFFHEFGHLLAALWRGLYIQRFSVGFGRKIWGVCYKDVEYIVSILPFGGYVALPQLDPTDEVQTIDGQPLPPASPLNRSLAAVAGPIANILFGFFLGLFIWWLGVYKPAPVDHCDVFSVPKVLPICKDGLQIDDRIVAVAGTAVSATPAELGRILEPGQGPVTLRVVRGQDTVEVEYTPLPNPEYEAGLRAGDRIVAVNGKGISRGWDDLSRAIVLTPGEVALQVVRDGREIVLRYRPAANPEVEGLGYPFFRVRAPIVVDKIIPGAPAERAGVLPRDWILAINGEPVLETGDVVAKVRQSRGAPMRLLLEREGRKMVIPAVAAEARDVEGEVIYRIGIVFGAPVVLTHPNPWQQFVSVVSQVRATLRTLFARGSLVKAKHISGPVGILPMIYLKVKYGGFREGLSFIILITFSLAVFNLLPIPVLDGGHILYALIEMVTRRRIPARLAHGVQTAFAVLIITFMLYVTLYDVKRFAKFWRLLRPRQTEATESSADKPPAEKPDKAEKGAAPEPAAAE